MGTGLGEAVRDLDATPAIARFAAIAVELAEDGYSVEEMLLATVESAAMFVRRIAEDEPALMGAIKVGLENPLDGVQADFFLAAMALRRLGESISDCRAAPN